MDEKDFLRELYDQVKGLEKREHEEQVGKNRERNPYQRDFTRILYSSSFRRLQGKMQILGVEHDRFFRNRLTHSLEVSQIARSIATKIGEDIGEDAYKNDLYLIEAIALAHDIGHPTFGHSGERVLNNLSDNVRFEGNAQNFRVLRTLEKKQPNIKGLNLTDRTLLGILKYNVYEDKKTKKFLYKEDYEYLNEKLNKNHIQHRTIDVQILDLADEIAYAVHDLEDALSMKYFNIDELLYEFSKLNICKECIDFLGCAVEEAKNIAKEGTLFNTSEEYSHLFKKELTANLINHFINDIGIIKLSDEKKKVFGTSSEFGLGFKKHGEIVHNLKKLTFKCVNRSNNVLLYEKKGEIIIKGLYDLFTDTSFNKDNVLLPPEYRPQNNDNKEELERNVIDYISGMMDSFAISTYERYYGTKFLDITYKPEKPSNDNPPEKS